MARSDWEVSVYIDTVVEQVELRHKKNIERGKEKDDRAYGTLRHDRNGGQLAGRHLTRGLEMRSGGELWVRAYERAKLNVVMRVSRVNQKKVVVIESAPPLVPLIFLFSVSFRTVLMNPRIAVPEQETAKCSSRSSSVFTFQSGSYDTKGLDHLPTFSKDRRNTCTVYMQVSAYILQPQKTTVPWASFSHTLHRVNDLDDSVQLHDLFSRGSNFRPKYFERVYINHRYVRAHFS